LSVRRSASALSASPQATTRAEPDQQKLAGEAVQVPDRQPSFHSISAIAADLDVSPKSVRRYIERGELSAYKVGGQIRVSDENYREFLKSRRLSK
jgi:excisionase family DNA binding protein